MIAYFDHTYSFVADNDLDANMARWEAAGFPLLPGRVKHGDGTETAFVQLTGSYLEFVAISDRSKFEAEATEPERETWRAPRVIGLGAVSKDPLKVERRLRTSFPDMKPAYSRGTADKPEDILWTYCPMPIEANPGVHVFAFRNHKRHARPVEAKVGENTVFGITGLVFCSESRAERRAAWIETYRDLLPGFSPTSRGFRTRLQRIEWITPDEYARDFDEPWPAKAGLYYDTAAVRLGCGDPQKAKRSLEAAGMTCRWLRPKKQFVTSRDPNTGYALLCEHGDAAAYLAGLAM